MRFLYTLLFTNFILLYSFSIFGQQTSSVSKGEVKGVVLDTTNNYVLQSATASVYKLSDSSLISFQITNNYGEFIVRGLPFGVPLRIEITHIGYSAINKTFKVNADTSVIDLKTLIMTKEGINLDLVSVSVPPMTMNGDTLEFNAGAFKLDSNAVIEDMLRKIENITLWGDGKITVNGTEIKSLVVNGKQFFGTDAKIAIQNIPKSALQKVQIYNKAEFNPDRPLDSIMEMNLKLKKGKDMGYFGKIGVGYGTSKRFDSDANINIFKPKFQMSVVGAYNNINKMANDANTLIENSTFKSTGTNMNYQSNFRMGGVNRPLSAGLKINYSFLEKPNNFNTNEIGVNYFNQDLNIENTANIKRTTSLSENNQIIDQDDSKENLRRLRQKFDLNYRLIKNEHYLNIKQVLESSKNNENRLISRRAENNLGEMISVDDGLFNNNSVNNHYGINIDYTSPLRTRQRFGGFDFRYRADIKDNRGERTNISDFRSLTSPGENRMFNRKYDHQYNNIEQQLDINIPRLKKLIFGDLYLSGLNLTFTNNTSLNFLKNIDRVGDLFNNVYQQNDYLSNSANAIIVQEMPGLDFSKIYSRNLSSRFSSTVVIGLSTKYLFAMQNNRSDKLFQNLDLTYSQFLPEAHINYKKHVYGEYETTFSINYNTTAKLPDIQQLIQLTDSVDMYNMLKGNLSLKKSVERGIAVRYNYINRSSPNPLSYGANFSLGQISDAIVDSTFIDEQNRRTIYKTNADGYQYFRILGEIQKAFKMKGSELQLSLNPAFTLSQIPLYINNVFIKSNNSNVSLEFRGYYTRGSLGVIEVKQNYSTYSTRQKNIGTQYKGWNLATTLNSNVNLAKKMNLGTDITFNRSTAAGNDAITFAIWNFGVLYRLLKGNNLEIKLTALDILRQNNSVINFGNQNSYTIGTRNVLKQYLMINISYFPRQFGKRN